MSYSLRVLGGFELLHDGVQVQIGSAKQRCLLATLALALPNSCNRDVLAERLWGGRGDGGASQNLRTALSQLRKQFAEEPVLVAHREEVRLEPDLIKVDALEFKRLLRDGDPQSLHAAADLYSGDFLSDIRIRDGEAEQWVSDQRRWYRARALEAFVKLSDSSLAAGDLDAAIQEARRAVLLDDLAEEAHRALLNALLASNRRGEAMRHARAMLELFESSLGVSPSPATMAVIERVTKDSGAPAVPPQVLPPEATSATSLSPAPAVHGEPEALIEQRMVVALSYEIVGVAEIAKHLDPESLTNLISELDRIVRTIAEEWLGVMGGAALDRGTIFFGVDCVSEDYASDAVTAANELSEAIANFRWSGRPNHRFALRTALDSSLSLVFSTGKGDAAGPKVVGCAELNARRICLEASDPGILVSDNLRNRVSSYFKFNPYTEGNGAEPVWQLVTPRRPQDRFEARRQRILPITGRRSELDMLISRWSDAQAGHGQIAIIRGSPGIGKSRLLYDLRGRLKASSLRPWLLQCTPGGERTAFSPIANLFVGRRRWLQQPDAVFARAARRLGASSPDEIEHLGFASGLVAVSDDNSPLSAKEALRHTRQAIQSMITARVRRGPLCVIIEDIHWADPSTLTELEALAKWIANKPLLIVLTTRDDALRAISDESNTLDLTLRRLDRAETQALATALWEMVAEDRPTPDQVAFLAALSEGIPLYLEELVLWRLRMERVVGPSPALRKDTLNDPTMPLNDLLLSRMTFLGEGRKVAQVASVIGRSFDLSMLEEVAGDLLPAESLPELLQQLVENNILRQIWPPPEAEYEFRHSLLREAAYSSLRDADRRVLHWRMFKWLEDQPYDDWPTMDVDLAWHAERAGNYRIAAKILAKAGRDSAARSAIAEARSSLSHALELTDHIDDVDARERLHLEIVAALGPLLTSQFGPRDRRAQQLYDRGVDIARRRPGAELGDHFPIFWGWWYTGSDFRVMHDRALRVQEMLAELKDPEIQLQINHCIWAIDFNLGRHRETLLAIEKGLALYDATRAQTNRALFGGHDAKVCGLGQKALSLWLTGQSEASDAALAEMLAFIDDIGHLPSRAHAFDTEAVSAFYREDFSRLVHISKRMRDFAAKHEMEFLTGLSLLFGGWAKARLQDLATGHEMFITGLGILKQLGSIVDLPIYLYMQATILGLQGKPDAGIIAVTEAISQGNETGHSYWLAELYRCRAELRVQAKMDSDLVAQDLRLAMVTATEQGARALLDRTIRSARGFGFGVELSNRN
ncbi:putative ATPase [Mesorhizobium sp. J18]|uniref:BTAD domain-containing putative transcriptional regulator n=1 Tax=Mesorhizobium sp. J18 TaxID=935263 RepID=UPI00119941B2|nr:AAA family ATPase [Mesorhizobium sp. J18]TWG98253.1 putative ATPase [Mesorhizobium sp. J18]